MHGVASVVLLWCAACTFQPGVLRSDASTGAPDALVVDAEGDGSQGGGAFRKAITIDGSKLSGAHTDFPLWVTLVDTDLAAHATTSGTDIYFTASDGTELDHEIQTWDPMTGTLGAWVRLPILAQASPPQIYIVYGDPARARTPSPAAVFSAGYVAVWHLDDLLALSTIVDATGTHDGTATGLVVGSRTAGKLGAGITFDGSGTSTIAFTNPLTGSSPHTISAWVDQATVTRRSAILAVGTAVQNQARWLYAHYTTATLACGFYSNDWVANNSIDGASWTHIVWVFEGANGVNRLYRNGMAVSGSPQTLTGVATTGTEGVIGAGLTGFVTPNGMVGTLDEIRIATSARSASWIAVEHANQSAPSTFYSIGAEAVIP